MLLFFSFPQNEKVTLKVLIYKEKTVILNIERSDWYEWWIYDRYV